MQCKDCLYFKRCVVLGVELDMKHDKDAEKNCRHFTAKTGEWIDVNERLPDEPNKFIVHYVHKYADNDGYWALGLSQFDTNLGKFIFDCLYKITHWMPLPEPPEQP